MSKQQEWVWGIHAVGELLKQRAPQVIKLVFLAGRTDERINELRALALEARGRAADRTRTQEEIDAAEAAKLEEAERGRLKRQRAGDSDDDVALSDGDDDGMRAGGGYAARRAKSKGSRAKDDDGDDGAKKEKKTFVFYSSPHFSSSFLPLLMMMSRLLLFLAVFVVVVA